MTNELPVNKDDEPLTQFLQGLLLFASLSRQEIGMVVSVLKRCTYQSGEVVFEEGEVGDSAYIVEDGRFSLDRMGRRIKTFSKGDIFGEVALIDKKPRMGTVTAVESGTLLKLDGAVLEDETSISLLASIKIYKELGRQVTSYLREEEELYREMDVLLVQDGGCAPGYNPVTAFITRYLENRGRQVYVAAEGFKSLVNGHTKEFYRLIDNSDLYKTLDHIPGVFFAPPLRDARGARFRTERYKEFIESENQQKAARNIINRNAKVLVGIGGNGTFAGIKQLGRYLPERIQLFFIPVTIDSDLFGTECIGEHTGVEVGAEKIHCYLADARTHHRCYIIELMGADGGYHALHSCLGAGAHLAVPPSYTPDPRKVADAIKDREYTVIVVAEGYKKAERKAQGYPGNAAEYLRDELLAAGLATRQRVICEGFSRDIRGAIPNNRDIMLAQQMARILTELIVQGKSSMMPAVLSGKEYAIPFEEIRTDNSVESGLVELANRLQV
ncbi:MAG: 6-phosphofructokinase [Deltaproteobacteria bacterium]|nr:6-phosphofructokinase [Deltaproteobacteria bacterium]